MVYFGVMVPLSKKTVRLVEKKCPRVLRSVLIRLLETECADNLPYINEASPEGLERIRFAVIKIGQGSRQEFIKAVELAKIDWRDLLVWAGFEKSLDVHNLWAKNILQNRDD